jgi:Zn-dependent peptidase ImmA (M78 family)
VNDRISLARIAQRTALSTRRQANIDRLHPLCVFDLAESLGVEVRFRPEPSLNGMYVKSSQGLILVSANRPAGRQAFTCAHELGHHVFEHGTRVDEYLLEETRHRSPEEFLADIFAAYLLMPPSAVSHAFECRGWKPETATPEQVYNISSYLGVGYESLINHLRWTLELISAPQGEFLSKVSPKRIKQDLSTLSTTSNIIAADHFWKGRAIDVQVGDLIKLPAGAQLEGKAAELAYACGSETILAGVRPGISRVELANCEWSSFIRVSRRNYVGRSIFRHLEDPDDD